jgi:RimJ/RimL family protein N-acetyltransferase
MNTDAGKAGMSQQERWAVSWQASDGLLEAHEPTSPEIAAAAVQLSDWYNEDHNRAMMSNEDEMSPAEVCAHYADVSAQGGRNFLLFRDGRLMGDADLRHVDLAARTAEFAILVGERNVQGRGFGTRFTLMLHALAFLTLGLEHIYVAIIPKNRGSLRLFEKLGYRDDDSPAARSYVDQDDDVTKSFSREEFLRLHGEIARQLDVTRLPSP